MSTVDMKTSSLQEVPSIVAPRNLSAAPAPDSPLLPEIGVLALVPDLWHWQWQPRHQVMTRLARYFNVVWLNPAEDWRKSLRMEKFQARREELPVAEKGFVVHTSSPFLPELYSPRWLAKAFLRKRLENALAILRKRRSRKIVLYLWRPEFASVLDLIPFDLTCYHIDDEYSFSPVDLPVSEAEARLIAKVDQVFIHSPKLLEKKGRINRHTAFAPNGVDFELYANPVPEPSDLAGIPHPRIGYSGHIKKQLDWTLLLDLTARHPEWSFVFVGAPNAHPEIVAYIQQLSERKNVRFLGSKTVQELAAYPQHFDVCVMPYKQDDYTKYIYPLKLHEYLASGKPVVGTPIASLLPHRDVLLLPETAEEWSSAISESLRPETNTAKQRSVRQNLARQHDWKVLVQHIAEGIVQHLDSPFSDRLAQYMQAQKETTVFSGDQPQ